MTPHRSVESLFAAAFSLIAVSAAVPTAARAQQQPQLVGEQVIQPQVERRELRLPRFPSKDIEVGLYAGTYSTENFGASAVGGLRLGYHISEDVFMQFTLAQTKVSDENFRQILPGGLNSPLLNVLNARYIIIPNEAVGQRPRADIMLLIASYPEVFRNDTVRVLENPNAMPRAWITHRVVQAQPELAAAMIEGPAFDPAETVILSPSAGTVAATQPMNPGAESVQIVEYERIPDNVESWSVAGAPELVIGSVESEGPDAFGRIDGVAVLSTGVLVVADGLNSELRAFDRSGRHVWTVGRRGEGPGEFASLVGAFAMEGDSVLALSSGRTASPRCCATSCPTGSASIRP